MDIPPIEYVYEVRHIDQFVQQKIESTECWLKRFPNDEFAMGEWDAYLRVYQFMHTGDSNVDCWSE